MTDHQYYEYQLSTHILNSNSIATNYCNTKHYSDMIYSTYFILLIGLGAFGKEVDKGDDTMTFIPCCKT